MATRRPRKREILETELASSDGSLADIKRIAVSLKLMEDRYMARPAAELLVERGDPAAQELAAGLAATPVLGKDPKGDRLRAAFKQALQREGIPPEVDRMARDFYARRGGSKSDQGGGDWIAKSDEGGGVFGTIRRLFGS